jgi:hypothetical protein
VLITPRDAHSAKGGLQLLDLLVAAVIAGHGDQLGGTCEAGAGRLAIALRTLESGEFQMRRRIRRGAYAAFTSDAERIAYART